MSTENRNPAGGGTDGFDRELSLKGILGVGLGLLLATALAAVLVWFLSVALRADRVAQDPPLPVLPEARRPQQPSGPRLQASPEAELREHERDEQALVGGYGWVEQSSGIVHIPVARARALLLEKGLPVRGEEPTATADQAPSSVTETATGEVTVSEAVDSQ